MNKKRKRNKKNIRCVLCLEPLIYLGDGTYTHAVANMTSLILGQNFECLILYANLHKFGSFAVSSEQDFKEGYSGTLSSLLSKKSQKELIKAYNYYRRHPKIKKIRDKYNKKVRESYELGVEIRKLREKACTKLYVETGYMLFKSPWTLL